MNAEPEPVIITLTTDEIAAALDPAASLRPPHPMISTK